MAIEKLNMNFKPKGTPNNIPLSPTNANKVVNKIDEIIDFNNLKIVTKTNEDLNNYQETGYYFFDFEKTPVNIPSGRNGWLQVIKGNGNFVKQIWYRAGTPGTNDFETFVRTRGSEWGTWKKYDIVEDTGWKDLPLATGITTGSVIKKAQYRKIGKTVEVRGDVSGISQGSTTIAILPVDCRPTAQIYAPGICSGQRYCRYYVQGTGVIGIDWTSDNVYNLPWYGVNIIFTVD